MKGFCLGQCQHMLIITENRDKVGGGIGKIGTNRFLSHPENGNWGYAGADEIGLP